MRKTAITLAMLAGLSCTYANDMHSSFSEYKTIKKAVPLEIPAEECRDTCGGTICYEDIVRMKTKSGDDDKPYSYTISGGNFEDFNIIGNRMRLIVADGCIFYRVKTSNTRINLERLH